MTRQTVGELDPALSAGGPDMIAGMKGVRIVEPTHRQADSTGRGPLAKECGSALGAKSRRTSSEELYQLTSPANRLGQRIVY